MFTLAHLDNCQVTSPLTMTNQGARASLLGQEITKRLAQLGLSRREFARRANIGRQTLQDIIHNPDKRISDRTFAALDSGLKWSAGTSRAFHNGNENARNMVEPSVAERIDAYLLQILQRLAEMDIEQLEREVIILEEESTEFSRDTETSRLIERQIQKLVASLLRNNPKGDANPNVRQKDEPPKNNERGHPTTNAGG